MSNNLLCASKNLHRLRLATEYSNNPTIFKRSCVYKISYIHGILQQCLYLCLQFCCYFLLVNEAMDGFYQWHLSQSSYIILVKAANPSMATWTQFYDRILF